MIPFCDFFIFVRLTDLAVSRPTRQVFSKVVIAKMSKIQMLYNWPKFHLAKARPPPDLGKYEKIITNLQNAGQMLYLSRKLVIFLGIITSLRDRLIFRKNHDFKLLVCAILQCTLYRAN